jgi:hypothetical protein
LTKKTYQWIGICLSLLAVPGGLLADAIDDVNRLRLAAGLPVLAVSAELAEAAKSHASYLARYVSPGGSKKPGSAHEQRSGLPEFTGRLAPDRAIFFGYAHSQVIENVSLGNLSAEESVSNLMSAIYHRFAFLNFEIDEIGVAQVGQHYVYNMGRTDLVRACVEKPTAASASPAYNCLGQKMKLTAYQGLCDRLPAEARYSAPYTSRCSNGNLLNSEFMQRVCLTPPEGAVLNGPGRYYKACNNKLRINAEWFEQVCQSSSPAVIYQHTGNSYQICSPPVSVHADWYQKFCATLPENRLGTGSGTYYSVCTNGFKMNSEYFDNLKADALISLPDAILWPADGTSNIQPVFYDEDPNPTPDLPMTGYPISIQFNQQAVDSVVIMGFTLEMKDDAEASGWKNLPQIRMIDHLTDINDQFSTHQFAWFPLQRLKWGAHYRYRVDALVGGVFRQYKAHFATTELAVPMYEISGEFNDVTVAENHFILYREPDAYDNSPFRSIELNYRNRPFVDVQVIDTNTVELNVGGSGCAPVLLSTRLEEVIYINFCQNSGRDKRRRG